MLPKLTILALMFVPLAGCKDSESNKSLLMAGTWVYAFNGDHGSGQVQWILRPDGSATIYAEDGANWASRPARWNLKGDLLYIMEAGNLTHGTISWIDDNSFEFTCNNPGLAGSKLVLRRT